MDLSFILIYVFLRHVISFALNYSVGIPAVIDLARIMHLLELFGRFSGYFTFGAHNASFRVIRSEFRLFPSQLMQEGRDWDHSVRIPTFCAYLGVFKGKYVNSMFRAS